MYRIEYGAVADVTFVKLRPCMNRTAMTRLQIVNDDDLFSLFNKLMNGMRADVAGAAANQISQNAPHAFAHKRTANASSAADLCDEGERAQRLAEKRTQVSEQQAFRCQKFLLSDGKRRRRAHV